MNIAMPLTTTSTELQRHYKKIESLARRTKKPIIVLSRNKPILVIFDYKTYIFSYEKMLVHNAGR